MANIDDAVSEVRDSGMTLTVHARTSESRQRRPTGTQLRVELNKLTRC